LLAVLAHPDDESFGMGGTLALYAKRGAEVHLVCATRGEAGEMDPDCLEGFTSVADRREHELRCAAEILGLAGVHFLDYRDSGMPGSEDNRHPQALAAAPLEAVAARVVYYIRKLRPQVVITFDPIGGYKHPDHIAIHKATVLAFQAAGDLAWQAAPENLAAPESQAALESYVGPENLTAPESRETPAIPADLPPYQPQKLYYHVFPKTWMRLVVRLMPLLGRDPRHFGRNGDIDLADLVDDGDFPIHALIDYGPVQEQKELAAACHASQLGGGPPRRGLIGWIWHQMAKHEHFMRARPPADGRLKEHDLFAGLEN
jgi:LmbE family N-acetylglucosaminyl deacetylase